MSFHDTEASEYWSCDIFLFDVTAGKLSARILLKPYNLIFKILTFCCIWIYNFETEVGIGTSSGSIPRGLLNVGLSSGTHWC